MYAAKEFSTLDKINIWYVIFLRSKVFPRNTYSHALVNNKDCKLKVVSMNSWFLMLQRPMPSKNQQARCRNAARDRARPDNLTDFPHVKWAQISSIILKWT